MSEPKPAPADKALFRDCPLEVRILAQKAAKGRRAKARAAYAKANGLTRPGGS